MNIFEEDSKKSYQEQELLALEIRYYSLLKNEKKLRVIHVSVLHFMLALFAGAVSKFTSNYKGCIHVPSQNIVCYQRISRENVVS